MTKDGDLRRQAVKISREGVNTPGIVSQLTNKQSAVALCGISRRSLRRYELLFAATGSVEPARQRATIDGLMSAEHFHVLYQIILANTDLFLEELAAVLF